MDSCQVSNGDTADYGRRRFQFNLKHLFLVVTILAFALGVLHALTTYEIGEGVEQVSWLPRNATNISFYKSYQFTAFEFDISEDEFREWARKWSVEPISTPHTIRRYTWAANYRRPSAAKQAGQAQLKQEDTSLTPDATVANGYFYKMRWSNGGSVAVAYDRTRGRAFYQSNPR